MYFQASINFYQNFKISIWPCLETTRRTCGPDPDYQTWMTWISWGCPGEWLLPGSTPASGGALCQKRTVNNKKIHTGLHNELYKNLSWTQYLPERNYQHNTVVCTIIWNHVRGGSIFMKVRHFNSLRGRYIMVLLVHVMYIDVN